MLSWCYTPASSIPASTWASSASASVSSLDLSSRALSQFPAVWCGPGVALSGAGSVGVSIDAIDCRVQDLAPGHVRRRVNDVLSLMLSTRECVSASAIECSSSGVVFLELPQANRAAARCLRLDAQ